MCSNKLTSPITPFTPTPPNTSHHPFKSIHTPFTSKFAMPIPILQIGWGNSSSQYLIPIQREDYPMSRDWCILCVAIQ